MTSTTRLAVAAILAGFLFASTSPAHAGDDFDDSPTFGAEEHDQGASYVLRDERGRRTGTLEQEGTGYLIQRDNAGRRTGTMEQDTTGQWIMRDTAGRRVGTVERR